MENPNRPGDKILYDAEGPEFTKIYIVGYDPEEVIRWGMGPSYERHLHYICTTCGRVLRNDYFTNLSLKERIENGY